MGGAPSMVAAQRPQFSPASCFIAGATPRQGVEELSSTHSPKSLPSSGTCPIEILDSRNGYGRSALTNWSNEKKEDPGLNEETTLGSAEVPRSSGMRQKKNAYSA